MFTKNVEAKYTAVLSDVTQAKKLAALEEALNIFVTPYRAFAAVPIGGGVLKLVKFEEDWVLPAPALKLSNLNDLTVLASDGSEVLSTVKLDEAFIALDRLLMEKLEQ